MMARPLRGKQLASFFQEARRLIEVDAGMLQNVVQALASEGGLHRVLEMVGQEFEMLPQSLRESAFESQVIPFLEIISDPGVVRSLILEQAVGTLYNFLYGIDGTRAFKLFRYIGEILAAGNKDEKSVIRLEVSLYVFARMLDINSTALVQEPLKDRAREFEAIFLTFRSTEAINIDLLHPSQVQLERLLRRFEIGSSFPTAENERKSKLPTSNLSFQTRFEPPGGRHDNDHMNIGKIKVMPSHQEIMSNRAEYLPTNNPSQWHLEGADGLIDRNFRLLREDTIGQLRDAIYCEIRKSKPDKSRTSQQRTFVYHDVKATRTFFDKLQGFHFEVKFPQPTAIKGLQAQKIEDWWQMSKRLQAGGLVCLLLDKEFVVFCTVLEPRHPVSAKEDQKKAYQTQGRELLWQNQANAFVRLEIVDPEKRNIKAVLEQCSDRMPNFTLVEFPGILLPAFEPTLRALQPIKKSRSLPFSDLLVPSGNRRVHISPPFYTHYPGFVFNLRCLMNNGEDFFIRNDQPVDFSAIERNSSLDIAQVRAVVDTLRRKIGLIQGPPGTGKSYTGVALIKVLLANKIQGRTNLGPILCVTYTNHALDQLLEALLDKNVTSQIIRIGSRSKSEQLQKFNIHKVARNMDRTKMEKSALWTSHRRLDQFPDDFRKVGFWGKVHAYRLISYLQEEFPRHHNQLFGTDHEGFQIAYGGNPQIAIERWLHRGEQNNQKIRSQKELESIDLFAMTRAERQALHDYWIKDMVDGMHEKIIQLCASHNQTKVEYNNTRDELDLRCLNEADVIGLTTAGLARNLNVFRRLQSKVVLCEEAGEVLEANLLAALLPSIEHAILIGDHLQLRPQIQNYDLSRENSRGGEQYSFDVSLFERLVDSETPMGAGLPFSTLTTQRRMHPSIAQLVRDTLYPELTDAPSVSQYPSITGVKKRLFWLDHRMPEANASKNEATSTSHWNAFEIEMTSALVNHLIRQSQYRSGDIAVLTPYLGQLHRLRQKLSQSFAITVGERDQDDLENAGFDVYDESSSLIRSSLLQALRVATVDNFQGEEAKIVVISLVRSNPQNRCGFLRTSNRINVLLSRAQHGMYIIGNSETSAHVPMWANVIQILKKNGNIGMSLELECPRHPETHMAVSKPDDFPRISPEGGCDLQCVGRLSCGHPCVQKCHSELLHDAVHCLEPCPRPRKGCAHTCPKACGDRCPPKCTVSVFLEGRELPCGHLMENLPCWQSQDLSVVRCPVIVTKEVPSCRHQATVPCHIDFNSNKFQCNSQCSAILLCGHTCKRLCKECVSMDAFGHIQSKHGICEQPCGRNYSTCAHQCTASCHGDEPCPPCESICSVQCGHSKCMKKCCEPCALCAEEECLSSCPHSQCTMPCAAPCNHVPCSLRCKKSLECGHQCPSVCGEICPPSFFCQECGSDDVKGYEVDFILFEKYRDIDLDMNPCIFPKCGHFMTMENMDAQMDLKQHYNVDSEGKPVSVKAASDPFSIENIKTCATCRGSLRDIARYGRLVRRAILDESTKKLILYLNREFVPLAQELPDQIRLLQGARTPLLNEWPTEINLNGSSHDVLKRMMEIMEMITPGRWKGIGKLRAQVKKYRKRVAPEEQPLAAVHKMVENARRRNKTAEVFQFDDTILQTKGIIQATALNIRLDLALLADFLEFRKQRKSKKASTLELNLTDWREKCQSLIREATKANRVLQQTEGHIFLAQFHALEQAHVIDPESSQNHKLASRSAIEAAKSLCEEYPGQTQGLMQEVTGTENMLAETTFFTTVTNYERMTVIQAMTREFRGTGHWYYCVNRHPFTIGECGGAMEVSTCPECGAPVGGQSHRLREGVTHAGDLEEMLGDMNLN